MAAPTRKEVIGGIEVDIAPLAVINLNGLLENNEDEARKLFNAAQAPGFFYLDVRDDKQYVESIDEMNAFTEKYFHLPEDVKMKGFVKDDEFRGYKPGKLLSTFEILRDDLVNNNVVLPDALHLNAAALKRFMTFSHHICQTLLTRLSTSLWPNSPTDRLSEKHRPTSTSNSSLKIYQGPTIAKASDFPENKHTDEGTLTLLYSDQWGTQIQLPWNKQWAWIEPKAGHAIVNVADALQALTGGRLHSCLHRVSQVEDGVGERWVVTYFLRPELGAAL